MKKEYLIFVPDIKDLVENREVTLTIKDLTPGRYKYDARIVRAVLSSSAGKLPEGDVLRVRSWLGVLYPKPWAIKIIKDAGESEAGLPHAETVEAEG